MRAYRAELGDQADKAAGRKVLRLAAALVAPGHTAAGLANLSREIDRAFAEAMRSAAATADSLDQLSARRAERGAG